MTAHKIGIKGWPEAEKPRERLMRQGVDGLSNAELLCLLLHSGVQGKDTMTLAREILNCFGGLRGLFAAGWHELEKVKGLGPAKISTLLAAHEMTKRLLKEDLSRKNIMRDPQSVLDYLYACLRDKKKEVFKVMLLNKANGLITEKDLFEGTVDETFIHPREVVKLALEFHATSLILVHNHPSGRTQPSVEDREMTSKLQAACRTVSVKILDHIIIGDNQYFSFSENHIL